MNGGQRGNRGKRWRIWRHMMWSTRIQNPFRMWHTWGTIRQLAYGTNGHCLWLQGEKLLKLISQSTRIGYRAWGSYCCGIVVWWFISMRWSISIRLWLVVRLPSMILLSQLRTLSLPMTFLITETALIEANPCVRLMLVIGELLRGYC